MHFSSATEHGYTGRPEEAVVEEVQAVVEEVRPEGKELVVPLVLEALLAGKVPEGPQAQGALLEDKVLAEQPVPEVQ